MPLVHPASNSLLSYQVKPFETGDFEIVGFNEGEASKRGSYEIVVAVNSAVGRWMYAPLH